MPGGVTKPPHKKRTKDIRIPVNVAEDRALTSLADSLGLSKSALVRDLVRRECQSVRGAKKTKAA